MSASLRILPRLTRASALRVAPLGTSSYSTAARASSSVLPTRASRPLRSSHQPARRYYAEGLTLNSSTSSPAEVESQRLLEKGTYALETGDLDGAKEFYRRSLEVHPNASSHFNLGVCYYHAQDLPSAIKEWEAALAIQPESSDAHNNIASAHVLSKPARPDLAIHHLKLAAQLAPTDAEIQFNLGAVLEACEQLEESLIAYQRAQAGGIARAQENINNVGAKILGAVVANEQEQMEKERKESEEGQKEEKKEGDK